MIRRGALLLLPLALGSCTAASVTVEAYADGGTLRFRVDPDAFAVANCFAYFRILDEHGAPMWQVNGADRDPVTRECPRAFPMRYGQPPTGAVTVTAPQPLAPGRLYVIQGYGAISAMEGAFRVAATPSLTIEQVSPLDPAALAAVQANENVGPAARIGNDSGANATANYSQR